MAKPEYPTNYYFWEEDDHFPARIDFLNNMEVTVIGSEDVILKTQEGYEVPKDFLIVQDDQGRIFALHESQITQHDEG